MTNDIFLELLNDYENDQNLVNELLAIDNDIMGSRITFDELYNSIVKLVNKDDTIKIVDDTLFITDGNPLITIKILKNVIEYLNFDYIIFVNESYLGINEYLVNSFNNIAGTNIKLDKDMNYNKYIHKTKFVIKPIGDESLIKAVEEDFK